MNEGSHYTFSVNERLQGRVAIVTGGGHGIGEAYARRLAEEGAAVVIAELDGPAAERVAAEVAGLAIATDVADQASVDNMARRTLERFGRIDILVNNAAIFATVPMSRAPFDQIDPAEWDRMMAVNLRGTWLACRAVVPQMRKQRYGKIINISSSTAIKGSASRIHYVSSKAGIIGFTKTLAMEVGKDNICVNCIAPGSTLSEENADDALIKYRQAAAATRALQRMERPEDLVGAVAFFASSDSDFITGQTLVVDGGACLH
jgi:3-oxoacyl-[acyl-carrier protein] reductase